MRQALKFFVILVVITVAVNLLFIIRGQMVVSFQTTYTKNPQNRMTKDENLPNNSDVLEMPENFLKVFSVDEINVKPVIVQNFSVKTIRRMTGYKSHRAPQMLTCGQYKCRLTTGTSPKGIDLVFYNEQDLDHYRTPPLRRGQTLWGFMSKEPQNHINSADMKLWDGMFNYSITYARQSDGVFYNFRDKIVKRPSLKKTNFAAKYNKRQPKALWFVSHCLHKWKKHRVWSGRVEYVQELSKYLPIDVYTRSKSCRIQLGSLIKQEKSGHQPKLSDYTYYLSFESTLCTDYITEKFWKVLEANAQTIPVALGGQSIAQYERVAPPRSFIHVRNFTSPEDLASHLKFVASDDSAFNYYHQWKNKYYVLKKKKIIRYFGDYNCYFCIKAHERPQNVWHTFSKDFGSQQCLDVSTPDVYCSYYNLTCKDPQAFNNMTTQYEYANFTNGDN